MTRHQNGIEGVHLVGSVPLRDAEDVFRTASALLGPRLQRVSDGETGLRADWIHWQAANFLQHPLLEAATPEDAATYSAGAFVKLRSGAAAADLKFPELGYARVAAESFAHLSRLKRMGVVPPGLRFQVSLPTPLAPVTWFVAPVDQAAVEPAYEKALLAEIDALAATIPPDELAVQWDVAVEFALLEGLRSPHFRDIEAGIVERLIRIGNHVPGGVELGYHLCYGDAGHKHFKEPEDSGKLVRIANAISAGVRRPIDWIHLPVPRPRTDADYFAPLTGRRLQSHTTLYLGLVHLTDGIAGAEKRIRAAQSFVPAFGIGTECGMGRRPPDTIPDLLRLHAEIADRL
ncbi:hypothetical protein L6Q96_16430 [Candidatus Binatia bacterium]|nr:hypothetical protein [Candidatus Binatia bacterium]